MFTCEGMSQLDGKTVKAIYNQKPELFAQKPEKKMFTNQHIYISQVKYQWKLKIHFNEASVLKHLQQNQQQSSRIFNFEASESKQFHANSN